MSRSLTLAAILQVVCASGAAASPADVWTKLHRPLHVRSVAAGEPCPVNAVDTHFNFDKYGVMRGIGRGPAYPIGFSQPGSVLQYRGRVPPTELRIRSGFSLVGNPGVNNFGQRYRPSYTRFRAPGCYAYQIDGTTFSRVVLFQARLLD